MSIQKKILQVITLMLLLFSAMQLSAQHVLQVLPADSLSEQQIIRLNYSEDLDNVADVEPELQRILRYFFNLGCITATIDSIVQDSVSTKAWLYTGEKYQLSKIRPGNADEVTLSQSGYKEKLYTDRPFSPQEIVKLHENIIVYCENNGYPFARVKLDSISIMPDKSIAASLNLTLNQKVTIDTIIVKGNSKLHRKFIRNYFSIKKGDVYNESKVNRIGEKIKDLPFVTVIREHEVAFIDDKARIILYIDKQKASQFDGILGIAPNDQTSGKLLITGDVKLKLLSAFNRGELIDFNWRKLEEKTQDLNFHFNFPFLFSTPFGLDYQLHLYKKDTSYLNLTNNIGVHVMFNGYNFVKAFYENLRSNLLSTDSLENATVLPEYADVNTSLYGVGIDFNMLDYRYNPRKGYRFDLSGAIGSKKIKENSNINPALYDSIPLNSTLYRLELSADLFIPVFRSASFLIANKSGFIANENLFDNELYRIGGLKTLRGFDEESILASTYTVFTLEFRYLFALNSYFQVFFDGSYYERNANTGYFKDTPYGFGAGINFETRAGIFALSYALGNRDGQPIQFKSAKIHFGLTAKF